MRAGHAQRVFSEARSAPHERTQVTLKMVYEVLQQGRMRRTPEPDPRYPGLRCELTRMVCGTNLAVVVYVDMPRPELLVITVYDVREE